MPTASNANLLSRRYQRVQLTRHARKRGQQRAIAQDSVPLIKTFGEQRFDGHGGVHYVMTEAAIENLEKAVGRTKQTEKLAGAYIVVDAETQSEVLTIAHLH